MTTIFSSSLRSQRICSFYLSNLIP